MRRQFGATFTFNKMLGKIMLVNKVSQIITSCKNFVMNNTCKQTRVGNDHLQFWNYVIGREKEVYEHLRCYSSQKAKNKKTKLKIKNQVVLKHIVICFYQCINQDYSSTFTFQIAYIAEAVLLLEVLEVEVTRSLETYLVTCIQID